MIVLDTHALVWAVADSKRLSRAASNAIRRAHQEGGLAVSAITLWELASLVARGRIQAYGTVDASVRLLVEGVTVKAITPEIAALATQFPDDFSRDPADRLIGATARAEGLALVTRDENIRGSPLLKTIW
ncbi:MAG: VapC toxin family PIN domain ribonuclease [Acidobacteria bacterium]|nr:MAG: VapC toxin family PIN domain ribonuclease [Acidobacteriota bacterium]PYX64474.1 MAG: VapC toxin family PIN domain ribonuclease [Acidobacteriota bacterium]